MTVVDRAPFTISSSTIANGSKCAASFALGFCAPRPTNSIKPTSGVNALYQRSDSLHADDVSTIAVVFIVDHILFFLAPLCVVNGQFNITIKKCLQNNLRCPRVFGHISAIFRLQSTSLGRSELFIDDKD